jgi:hypothetical protein
VLHYYALHRSSADAQRLGDLQYARAALWRRRTRFSNSGALFICASLAMDNGFVEPLVVEDHSAQVSHPQLARLLLIRTALSAARANWQRLRLEGRLCGRCRGGPTPTMTLRCGNYPPAPGGTRETSRPRRRDREYPGPCARFGSQAEGDTTTELICGGKDGAGPRLCGQAVRVGSLRRWKISASEPYLMTGRTVTG